jgi:hypothetical protein
MYRDVILTLTTSVVCWGNDRTLAKVKDPFGKAMRSVTLLTGNPCAGVLLFAILSQSFVFLFVSGLDRAKISTDAHPRSKGCQTLKET